MSQAMPNRCAQMRGSIGGEQWARAARRCRGCNELCSYCWPGHDSRLLPCLGLPPASSPAFLAQSDKPQPSCSLRVSGGGRLTTAALQCNTELASRGDIECWVADKFRWNRPMDSVLTCTGTARGGAPRPSEELCGGAHVWIERMRCIVQRLETTDRRLLRVPNVDQNCVILGRSVVPVLGRELNVEAGSPEQRAVGTELSLTRMHCHDADPPHRIQQHAVRSHNGHDASLVLPASASAAIAVRGCLR